MREYEQRYQDMEDKLVRNEQYHEDKLKAATMEKIQSNLKNNQIIMEDLRKINDRLKNENQRQKEEYLNIRTQYNEVVRDKQQILSEVKKIKTFFEHKIAYTEEDFGTKFAEIQTAL